MAQLKHTLIALLLAMICMFFFYSQQSDASHFQFGTFEWDVPTDQLSINMQVTQAWRYKFFWNDSNWGTAVQRGLTRSPGSLKFTRLSTTSATSISKSYSASITLKVTGAWADPTTSSDGYWFGTWSGPLSNSIGIYANRGIYTSSSESYYTYFDTCCRIGSLLDSNANGGNNVFVWMLPNQRKFSLTTMDFPRVYIERLKPLTESYQLKSINRDKEGDLALILTPGSSGVGQSTLRTIDPGLWGPVATNSRLKITNNKLTWTPQISPNSSGSNTCRQSYCPYAISVTIVDYLWANAADANVGKNLYNTKRIATSIDWLLIVINSCDTSAVCPPRFVSDGNNFITIATVPNTISFQVLDNASNSITLENTPNPSDLSFTAIFTDTAGAGSKFDVTVVHDPDIDGSISSMMCFSAVNSNGLTSIGNFCPSFTVIKPNYLFVTGILREFPTADSTNRLDADSYAWPAALKPVSTLPASRIPTLATTSSVITNDAWDLWWNDATSTKLVTATLVSYYNTAIDNTMSTPTVPAGQPSNYYTTYPYMDPRRRVFSFRRPFWTPTTAQFYTYELHTTFDMLASQTSAATAIKFGVTGGELFVYADNVLIMQLSGATKTSPSESSLVSSTNSQGLTYNQLRTLISTPASTPTTENLTLNLDIFYTHRRKNTIPAASTYTGFHMEFGSSTQCSAITVLRSSENPDILEAAKIFDYSSDSKTPNTTPWDLSKFFLSNSATRLENKALRLLPSTTTGSAASIFYNDSLLKVLSGFEARFTFQASSTAPGFAFVIQSQSPSAKGSEGQGLGYAGIMNAIAIEFDMYGGDSVDEGFNFQHISAHKSSDENPRLTASETTDSWPLGSRPVGNNPLLPFTFGNNTAHDIRIEFSPTATQYWLYVYVNTNIKPVYTAQFTRSELDSWWASGAYVGFTTSNYGSAARSGVVDISKFTMTVIPPMARYSEMASPPQGRIVRGVAGSPMQVSVQLKDACKSNLLVRGESNRFLARFVHKNSRQTATGNNIDAPPVTITDVGGGVYSFTATPTRSGPYLVYVYYQEADLLVGEGQPIESSPFAYGAGYTGKRPKFELGNKEPVFATGQIDPTNPDSATSFYTFSKLVPSNDNIGNENTNGVFCSSAIPVDLRPADAPTFIAYNKGTYDTFKATLDTANVAVCVVRGAVAQSDTLLTDIFGSAYNSANREVFSGAWVVGGPTLHAASNPSKISSTTQSVVNNFYITATEITSSNRETFPSIYIESWSPTRQGTTVGRAMVLLSPMSLNVPTNRVGQFYLYSKDRYGNAIYSGPDVSFTFTPALTTLEAEVITSTPFTILPFETTRAGIFASQTFYAENPVQIGINGVIIVDAGAAHYSTSLQSGITVGGAVGTVMTFTLSLKDISENSIQSQTAGNHDRIVIRWVDSENAARTGLPVVDLNYSETFTPATLTDTDQIQSAFVGQAYSIRYQPTFAGTFLVEVYVNPRCAVTATPAQCVDSEREMTSSKGKVVAITPGPATRKSIVTELNATGQLITPSSTYKAGEIYQFNVQTKDNYGNNRFSALDGGKKVKVVLYADAAATTPLAAADFIRYIDITRSSGANNAANAFIEGQYTSSGNYQFNIVFKTVVAGLSIQFHLENGSTIGELVSFTPTTPQASLPLNPTTVGTARWTLAITPGALAANSIISSWCPTQWNTAFGVALTDAQVKAGARCTDVAKYRSALKAYWAVEPFDMYDNRITPTDENRAAVNAAISLFFENNIGSYQYMTAFTTEFASGNYYIGSFLPPRSGTYEMKADFTQTSAPLQKPSANPATSWTFGVIPAQTSLDKSVTAWPAALGVSTETELTLIDTDFLEDTRSSTHATTTTLPVSSFSVYRKTASTCTVVVTACTATGASHSCKWTPQDAGNADYLLAAIGNTKVADATGALTTCATPASGACPTDTKCYRTRTLRTTTDGSTAAFIGGIARLNAAGTTEVTYKLLSDTVGTANEEIKFQSEIPASGSSTGIIAGEKFAVYLFQKKAGLWTTRDGMDSMALKLVGESSSKFQQFSIDATSNPSQVTLNECPSPLPANPIAICVGRAGAGYYRVVLSNTQVLTGNDHNKFAIYHVQRSSIAKIYSFSLRPAAFDAGLSSIQSAPVTFGAGSAWSAQVLPKDIYGNLITKQEDFIGWAPRAQLLTTLDVKITGTDTTGQLVTTPATPTITPSFVAATANADGYIKLDFSGHFFTKSGFSAYQLSLRITAAEPTTVTAWKATYVGRAPTTINITPAAINMPRSAISLIASTDSAAQLSSWAALPPQAGIAFNVFLFPKDLFSNPTDADDAIVFKATEGDRFNPLNTITFTNVDTTWAKSQLSTPNNNIYSRQINVNKSSRNGFKIVAELGTARSSVATFYARSQPTKVEETPTVSATVKLTGLDNVDLALTDGKHQITIDTTFKYRLRLFDANNLPVLYNVGPTASNDNTQVAVQLTSTQKDEGGSDIVKTLATSIVQEVVSYSGINVATPGSFIIESGALLFTGDYVLTVTATHTNGAKTVLSFTYLVKPGAPVIDYTSVTLSELSTGQIGTFKYKLYDRLQNLITDNLAPTSTATPAAHFPVTAGNKVYPSIHRGTVNCFDVHGSSDPNNLQYALPYVTPGAYPDYTMTVAFNAGEYTISITPVPSGTYTFNLRYFQTSLTVPASWYSCNPMIPLSFQVKTGPPVAANSYYTVTARDANDRLIDWSSAGPNVGYAGENYHIQLNLLDRDGSRSSQSAKVGVFFNPDGLSDDRTAPSDTIVDPDPATSLFFDPKNYGTATAPVMNANNNIVSASQEDYTIYVGYGLVNIKFKPKVARANWGFNIYMYEPVPNQANTFVWKLVNGKVPANAETGLTLPQPSISLFTVLHGQPKNIVVSNLAGVTTPIIAGSETSFIVTAVDAYGNQITTNTLSSIQVTISREGTTFTGEPIVSVSGLNWVVPSSGLTTTTDGVTTVKFTPPWEGKYRISIIMTSPDGRTTYASQIAPAVGSTMQISHASCAARELAANPTAVPTKIYMCASTGVCVANYSECAAAGDKITCAVGFTRVTPTSECVALTDPSVAYVVCPDGTYVKEASQCLAAISCPSGTVQCTSDKTQCRSKQTDCPAVPACPNGTIICPNGLTCATSLSQCPVVPKTIIDSCQDQGKFLCTTGQCVNAVSDCPTKPSCPVATQVYCLTDGSCQENAQACPQIPPGQVIDVDTCRNTGFNLVCPSGDKCVKDTYANCPSALTCPVGNVLCALDNSCKTSASLCPSAGTTTPTPTLPNPTIAKCSATEFRCPAGECVQNLALCSTEITCPASSPVLCADKTCKASLAVCTTPPKCAAGLFACAATGSCVSNLSQCSAPLSCPAAKPVLCPNSQCVTDISLCEAPISCPPALPYPCATSGVCRTTITDCPTLPSCPAERPMVCDDGSCALSVQMCPTSTTGSSTDGTTSASCDSGLIRCPSGSCSSNPLTCPSITTCTPGTSRCADGTCRASCSTVVIASCGDRNLVTCPQSASGVACAKALSECPQGFTCPLTKPVRCMDSTCALTTSDCPSTINEPPATRSPCPDGSWVTGTTNDCPTAVTCPPSAPIKCYDQTCKATLNECPVASPCDLESDTPFRCASGSCVAALWDCLPVDPSQCATASPIKCPSAEGNVCVAKLSECPAVGTTGGTNGDITTAIPDPIEQYASPCTAGFTYCRDGSCKDSPSACPVFSCPVAFSVGCDDGSCAVSKDKCPSASGCPWDTPVKCSGVGSCVKSLSQCPVSKCTTGLVGCPDGSCAANSSSCPASNGCRSNQFRCADGSCVSDTQLCSSQSNSNFVNSCPPGAPHKCANGLCVSNAFACPQISGTTTTSTGTVVSTCPGDKSVLCADGICRQSTELCPIVKPCNVGTKRCDDGFCRDLESNPNACPAVSNCPLGQIRCKQQDFPGVAILDGICAEPGQCIAVNGCPITGTIALQRCSSNGRCVADLSTCEQNIRQTNGCLADTPIKCWNGKCAKTSTECDSNNNCPFATPVRCPSGECVAAPTADQTTDDVCVGKTNTCTKVTCADGSCKDKASDCTTSFGCPVTAPVRCANGDCKALPASYRPFLSNELVNTLTCQPVIKCPSSNYYLCESGACVLSSKSCPSIAYTCSGDSPFRCMDGTCRPDESKCGMMQDPDATDPTEWVPSSSKPAGCPATLPVMCDDGSCVSDIFNCDRNSNPETTTITGSPSSSQRDSSKEFQVLCEDGTYRDSYAECRKFAQEINDAVSSASPALKCVDYCGNGRCVLEGQTVDQVCSVVPACEAGFLRCTDGSCRTDCSEVVEPEACTAGLKLDIDGVCRSALASLKYDGCYHNVHERYQCANRECAASEDGCVARETRKNDDFQLDALDNSEWGNENNSKNGRAQVQKFIVQGKTSFDAVPNTLIAQLIAQAEGEVEGEEQDETTPTPTPAPAGKTKACTTNCVAQQKALATTILYSPLLSSQTYPIGPLSTGLYISLSSGLTADANADTNLYIHPVAESQYYNATNKLTYSRIGEFGDNDALTAAQTVLSPAFSCSAGQGLAEPFAINVGINSLIDRSQSPTPQPKDVCLARLRRFPKFGYSTWQCIYTDEQRTSGDLKYAVRQSAEQPIREAISSITQCYDDDLSTIVDPTDTTTAFITQQDDADDTTAVTTTKVPAVYAFIHSPVATSQVYLPAKDNFWQNNVIWLLFVIIGGIFLIFVLVYAILRLSRYSSKTDKIKDEIANTEKEVEEMEQHGEKRRDEEVGYHQNPLAVSLEQQRELEETTNEEKLAKKKQIMEAQQADSAERKEVITTLETDNDAALAHLEQLRMRKR